MFGYGYGVGITPNVASMGVAFDSDAAAFFTAAGITDPTQKSAFNTYILGLKTDNLWSKIYQGLPLSFNDATKNSVDMKLAYDAIMNGSITHAAGGVQGDGVSGYINMVINPSTNLQQNNFGITFCCETDSNADLYDAGAYESFVTYIWLKLRYFDLIELTMNDDGTAPNTVANTNSIGTYSFNRANNTHKTASKNGTLISTLAKGSITPPNFALNLMRVNPLAIYSPRKYNMWFVHQAFDATEVGNFHTRIATLKTDLGI